MKKQLTQFMPTLVVMVLILALTVATYNISLRQEEEECFSRLENASETMVQSIQNRVNDDLNYLRLIGKDFSNDDHLPTYEEYRDRLSTFEDVSLFTRVDLLKGLWPREKEKTRLKNLSYVDSLTYAQNRNHFNEYIEKNRCRELHSLALYIWI